MVGIGAALGPGTTWPAEGPPANLLAARSPMPPSSARLRRNPSRGLPLLGGAILLAFPGCRSAEEHAAAADAQVYRLIEQRRAELFGEGSAFRIEPPEDSARQRLLRGELVELEGLGIADCLEIAAESNRSFQGQRESLYRAALDVTLERWRLGWRETAEAGASVSGTGGRGEVATGSAGFGLERVLGTGARILGNIGVGLVRVIGSGGGWDALGDLSLSITQPLLRGAGGRIVEEPLTQSERDLVYQARAYERFRRSLAVDVSQRVYRVLQQVDAVRNQRANVENLMEIRKRNEALAEAGRLSDIQVDQASQDELRSQNRLLVEEARLEQLLDDFKFFLGLPPEARIELDEEVLSALEQEGIERLAYAPERVVEFALARRLDFQTSLDRVEDARRRVLVAADALRAGLDVTAAGAAVSDPDDVLNYDFADVGWILRLDLDLPVDRLPERNLYRSALITLQSSARDAEELADRIRTDLRDDLRLSRTTYESYQIQLAAEQLAARRVESTRLNLAAGRADTRDILEAQEALLNAQNATTQALIEHTLARLALFLDMELLTVDEQGIRVDTEIYELLPPSSQLP